MGQHEQSEQSEQIQGSSAADLVVAVKARCHPPGRDKLDEPIRGICIMQLH